MINSVKCKLSDSISDLYEIEKCEDMPDINSEGILFRHKKSGARVAVIKNDDENKVFSISFRTPPKDSKGTPHIIEHSVLCGSKKYPLKDPFIELAKGSLNTFLNAMTFSDKTMYPVASCNNKDFDNLMGVYMDAVFYPSMKNTRQVFEQEGWHYEMESAESPLSINGVVYNEMRGVFSSPEQQLESLIQQSLFPDTAYGKESGGDPDFIPSLSYEQFLEFYNEYYHPANSYIYLYGDLEVEEKLLWMDREYLSSFEKIEVDSVLREQKPFNDMKIVDGKYSAQSEEDKAYFSYNCVVDKGLDNVEQLALQVLSNALISVQGAPVRQALIDAGIADDIGGSYENEVLQPVFGIEACEADLTKRDEFVSTIRNELARIAKEGIDKKSLEASISYLEFKYREADFGRYPKGLMYGINMMQTWLYDDSAPFDALLLNDAFAKLKTLVATDYFENLVTKYLLDNRHIAVVSVFPEMGLSRKKDEELSKKLDDYKKTLSDEEIEKIVADTKALKDYQETPDTKEALMTIPLLKREDMNKKIPKIYLDKKEISGISILHHNLFTNGIAYVNFVFDVTKYKEYLSYLNLLSAMLGSVDTVNYKYFELANEINMHTGGINAGVSVRAQNNDVDKVKAQFELSVRVLYPSMKKSFEIITEIIKGSIFSDKKRVKEILAEIRSDLKTSMEAMGNSTAISRGLSYISETSYYQNQISGISFYRFLDDLYNNFDEQADGFTAIIETLVYKIFNKNNMIVSITCDDGGYKIFEDESFDFFEALYPDNNDEVPAKLNLYSPQRGSLNEGFMTAGKVQYVARTGNFVKKGYNYTGALKVLKTILGYEYLWQNVRVKGGAYGAGCGFVKTGNAYFASFRDPKLAETNDIYASVPEFIRNFDVDEREMTKYIIGTMSEEDAPLTPRAKGRQAFTLYMSGIDEFELQKERDEILQAHPEDIRALADLVQSVLDCDNICVIGSQAAIEENSSLFNKIEKLS